MASKQECCQEFITSVAKNKANHDETTKTLQMARSQSEELTRRLRELKTSLLNAESESEISDLNEQVMQVYLDQQALTETVDKGNKYIKNVLEPNSIKLNYLRDECFNQDYNSDYACNDPELAPKCCEGYQSTSAEATEGISGDEQRLRPDDDQDVLVNVRADIEKEPSAGDLGHGIDQRFIDETIVSPHTSNATQDNNNQMTSPKQPTSLSRQQDSYNSVSKSNPNSIIGPASPAANYVANLAQISSTTNLRGSKTLSSLFLTTGAGNGS